MTQYMLPSAVNTMAESAAKGASASDDGPPTPITLKSSMIRNDSDGTTPDRLPLEVDTRLPPGWWRKVCQRMMGSSAGTYDVYVFSPEKKKFRSTMEVLKYAKDKNRTDLDPFIFDFSTYGSSNITLAEKRHQQDNPTPRKPKAKTPAVKKKAAHKLVKQKAIGKGAGKTPKAAQKKKGVTKAVTSKLVVKMNFVPRKRRDMDDQSPDEEEESNSDSDSENEAEEVTETVKPSPSKKSAPKTAKSPAAKSRSIQKSAAPATADSSKESSFNVLGTITRIAKSDLDDADDEKSDKEDMDVEKPVSCTATPRKRTVSRSSSKGSTTPLREANPPEITIQRLPVTPMGKRPRRSSSREITPSPSSKGKNMSHIDNAGFHTPKKRRRDTSRDSYGSLDEDDGPPDITHSQVDGAAADTPPRRGRGRPRRDVSNDNVKQGTSKQNQPGGPETPRRGRGRPKRNSLGSPKVGDPAETSKAEKASGKATTRDNSTTESDSQSPTKRLRGRPKTPINPVQSDPVTVSQAKPDESGEPRKRGRGRPRRSVLGTNDTDNDTSVKQSDSDIVKDTSIEEASQAEEASQEEATPETPAKRGRGRPKKILPREPPTPTAPIPNLTPSTEQSMQKGRGKPPKKESAPTPTPTPGRRAAPARAPTPASSRASRTSVAVDPEDSITESPESPEVRPRGRPSRKAAAIEKMPEKPRGRPRKLSVEAQEEEESTVIVTTAEVHREAGEDDDGIPILSYEGKQKSVASEAKVQKEPPMLIKSSTKPTTADAKIKPPAEPELPALIHVSPRKSARKPKPNFHKDFVSPTRKIISIYEHSRMPNKKEQKAEAPVAVATASPTSRGRGRPKKSKADWSIKPAKTLQNMCDVSESEGEGPPEPDKKLAPATPVWETKKKRGRGRPSKDATKMVEELTEKIEEPAINDNSRLDDSVEGMPKVITEKIDTELSPNIVNSHMLSLDTPEQPIASEKPILTTEGRAILSAMLLDHAYTKELSYSLPPEILEEPILSEPVQTELPILTAVSLPQQSSIVDEAQMRPTSIPEFSDSVPSIIFADDTPDEGSKESEPLLAQESEATPAPQTTPTPLSSEENSEPLLKEDSSQQTEKPDAAGESTTSPIEAAVAAEPNTPSTEADNTTKPTAAPIEADEPTTPLIEAAKPTTPPTEAAEPKFPPIEAAEPTTPPAGAAEPTTPPTGAPEPTTPATKSAEPTAPATEEAEPRTPLIEAAKPTTPPNEAAEPTIPSTEAAEPTTPPTEATEPTKPPTETAEPTTSPTEPVQEDSSTLSQQPEVPKNATVEPEVMEKSSTEAEKTVAEELQEQKQPEPGPEPPAPTQSTEPEAGALVEPVVEQPAPVVPEQEQIPSPSAEPVQPQLSIAEKVDNTPAVVEPEVQEAEKEKEVTAEKPAKLLASPQKVNLPEGLKSLSAVSPLLERLGMTAPNLLMAEKVQVTAPGATQKPIESPVTLPSKLKEVVLNKIVLDAPLKAQQVAPKRVSDPTEKSVPKITTTKRKASSEVAAPTAGKVIKSDGATKPRISGDHVSKQSTPKVSKDKSTKMSILGMKQTPTTQKPPRDMAASVPGLVKPMGIKGMVIARKTPIKPPASASKKVTTPAKPGVSTALQKLEKTLKGTKSKDALRATLVKKGQTAKSPVSAKKVKLASNEKEKLALLIKQKKGHEIAKAKGKGLTSPHKKAEIVDARLKHGHRKHHEKGSLDHRKLSKHSLKKTPGKAEKITKSTDKHKKHVAVSKEASLKYSEKSKKDTHSHKDSTVDKQKKVLIVQTAKGALKSESKKEATGVKDSEKPTGSEKPLKGILAVKDGEKSPGTSKKVSLTVNTGAATGDSALTADSSASDSAPKTPEKSCLSSEQTETKSPNGTRRVSIGGVETHEIDQSKSPGPPSTSFDLASLAFAPSAPKGNKRRKSTEAKSPKVKRVGGTWSFTPLKDIPAEAPKPPTPDTPSSGPKSILKKS